MDNKLIVSQSPHLHAKDNVRKIMLAVIIALLPSLVLSFYFYGIGALVVTLFAVFFAVFFEWIFVKVFLKKEPTIWDGSAALTGLLLAFNVPSNLPVWIIIIGAFVAIGVGKMSFGGLGQNPFNPALVGRVFLLISFPVQMTSWPLAGSSRFVNWHFFPHDPQALVDGFTGATSLGVMKEGLKNGDAMAGIMDKIPTHMQMFYGQMGGSLGEISALLLILGGIFLLYRKIITWHIPGSIILTTVVFSGILWLINPQSYADPLFHLLTGGLMLGAIYMATDYSSSPMSNTGKIIFGIGIALLTIIIRNWGAYPEGVSFAILIMNAFVPLIDRQFKPKLFGKVEKSKQS
ncbi:MAG: RnfABCDGE type electron transport complex subunit D [Bacteroidales bacterium]|nr:RnfABCDGE type electron transport complex subunit D [Bacteroidales bacterium]